MSKTKRLLSVTLAIAMIILSAFSAFAEDTETVVEPLSGTVAAGDVTVEPDVTEVTVPVTITFENKQTSPHGMFDISAEGATLKSATLVSFNNDNYVKDPNLSDEENIDKSVYLDADGINSANGRIVVESSTDESKKPATSEVKIDVVLEFATALKADHVIDVVIDGIQATNFSEASWDGMKAVNGKITVAAAEVECDHDWEITSVDPATDASDTGSIAVKCNLCGETDSDETLDYKTTLLVTSAEAAYKSEILLAFTSWDTFLTRDNASIDDVYVYAEIGTSQKDGTIVPEYDTLSVEEAEIVAGSGKNYINWYFPVRPTNMNDVITFRIFVNISGEWYNGGSKAWSFTDYALTVYNNDTGNVADTEKDVIANVFNYGSLAQVHFGHDADNLPVDKLPDKSRVITDTATTNDYEAKINTPDTISAIWASTQLFMESRTEINYEVMITDSTLDVTALTVDVCLPSEDDADRGLVTFVHKSVATEQQLEDGHYFEYSRTVASKYDVFVLNFADLDSRCFRNLINATVKNGSDIISETKVYSVETQIAKIAADESKSDTEKAMYNAMMHYGDAAVSHFGVFVA